MFNITKHISFWYLDSDQVDHKDIGNTISKAINVWYNMDIIPLKLHQGYYTIDSKPRVLYHWCYNMFNITWILYHWYYSMDNIACILYHE